MVRKILVSLGCLLVTMFVLLGLGSISGGNLASASSPQDVVIVPAGEPIQIALATWMDASVPYQDYFDAFDMAVEDYGLVKDFSIQRNDFDAGCDSVAGQAAGNLIIVNTQNLGVVGPFCSISTEGMAPVLETAGVVMISYSNTRPDLGGFGWTIFNRTVVNGPQFDSWDVYISSLPSVVAWNDEFNSAYGRPPSQFAKYVYDATTLLLTRIDEVSTLDGEDNLLVDRSALATAVRETHLFTGITGLISLEPDGDRVNYLVIVPAGEPIQFALATWLDGAIPYQDYLDAADMAADAFGLIKGFSIQRVFYDSGCDFDTGEAAGTLIISDTQNLGVVGPFCSTNTRGMAPVLETTGVVMVSYSNTMPDLGGYGWTIFNRAVINDPFFNYWDEKVSSLPSAIAWSEDFNTNYGRFPDLLAKYVYDSTTLLLTRINEVSTLDGDGNLLVDRIVLSGAVRNTTSFMGVTDLITLEPDGDRVNLLTEYFFLPSVYK
jgi:ABC-type branched-subunit amino acid transport system substrate-binding protein